MKVDLTYPEFKAALAGKTASVFYMIDRSGAPPGDAMFMAQVILDGVTLCHTAPATPDTWAQDFPNAVEAAGMGE